MLTTTEAILFLLLIAVGVISTIYLKVSDEDSQEVTMKAQLNFSAAEKSGMLKVLAKYPVAPSHHQEVAEALKVDGSTVLWPDEALYLAGIIQPYYSFLAERLREHPAIKAQ